ncbi:hypothetical protein QBC37DRAFT_174413 [Rhypophila decipiens]|uniref:SMODS and SLOG-associating 2TM effector domain-containing protein n=1 Tax=Rhypophila decipiens TaxID=261697 RepID=A0AAN7B9R7_9PEZI|nr:hypothetical protein QBC37DRAFT_174413 [Rhypophila decipiens]
MPSAPQPYPGPHSPIPSPPISPNAPLPGIPKADTAMSWGAPAGLHVRKNNDENLIIFRRAVGISGVTNTLTGTTFPLAKTLEEGRGGYGTGTGTRGARGHGFSRGRTWRVMTGWTAAGGDGGSYGSGKKATGIYAAVLQAQKSKRAGHVFVCVLVWVCHFGQIILGASLTALGPTAGSYPALITLLGAINTVIAGILALIKGQGLAERLRHDQAEFRKLQDWIEQTEALLAVGVIGRNRQEVGLLVQVAFKKYNAAKASEENNVPENWVRAAEGGVGVNTGGTGTGHGGEHVSLNSHSHASLSGYGLYGTVGGGNTAGASKPVAMATATAVPVTGGVER